MRNIFAHNYIGMDSEMIWDVAVNDIPVLRNFCKVRLDKRDFCGEEEEGQNIRACTKDV